MASHPSCGEHWKLVPQSSIAVSLEKSSEFKFWQNQGENIFLHLYHRREIALVRNFYGAILVSKHDLHKKYPRIEFSKRNSQDLFCSGIRCQLTLNALQKILTGIKIITIIITYFKWKQIQIVWFSCSQFVIKTRPISWSTNFFKSFITPAQVCSLRPNQSPVIKCNVEKIMTLFHSFDIILEPGEFGK